jgi:hypothetical protein
LLRFCCFEFRVFVLDSLHLDSLHLDSSHLGRFFHKEDPELVETFSGKLNEG